MGHPQTPQVRIARMFGLSAIFQMFPSTEWFLHVLAGVDHAPRQQVAPLSKCSAAASPRFSVEGLCVCCCDGQGWFLLNLSSSSALLPAPCYVTEEACPCRAP